MNIAIPYFGDLAKFAPLLDRWFASYARTGLKLEDVTLISDSANVEPRAAARGCRSLVLSLAGFVDLIRPEQPFDHKGALVCAYLLSTDKPFLVLDADAFLAKDPRPFLSAYVDAPIAMPADHGALLYFRRPTLEGEFSGIKKLCAGVQFFGQDHNRSRLVAGYRRAWQELILLPKLPWTPPLPWLVEQYAWSICAHRRGGKVLPVAMNWAPVHLGHSDSAIVNHHYGLPKWDKLPEATQKSPAVLAGL